MKSAFLTLLVSLSQYSFADASVDQLKACDEAIRSVVLTLNPVIRPFPGSGILEKDLRIIRKWRKIDDRSNIADDLYIYRQNKAYKVELPVFDQHYLTDPKQLTVKFPEGEYCLHYEISAVISDKIRLFEKMPSVFCQATKYRATAVEASAEGVQIFKNELVQLLKDQMIYFDIEKRDVEITQKVLKMDRKSCDQVGDREMKSILDKLFARANQFSNKTPKPTVQGHGVQ